MSDTLHATSHRYLTFTLGRDMFALDIACVREILDMTEITRIPQAPEAVRGVVNVRGAAVPVVDLRLRFGMEAGEQTVHTRIIIVEIPTGDSITVLGAIADSVKEVLELEPDAIAPPPSMGTGVATDFLRGIGKSGGRFILILEISKVLGTSEVLSIKELGDMAAGETQA
ncbi:Chemotaxis protein CheW [Fundidesulfovibrio magnetotacticus]|uniref:Chemotaxis protein CheW n=1 Tax=Fundidesulfovibrio magnetotacticus TaxID=2730080 RepID=A0A6V8LLP9_9BACT|nr:chemotaxis protein CheW [Fundidesulfovibrio magnetotacticus]GFK93592.1 Chemotaxis protein CheW [Fundidesulfovibrio magnetotacticus]